MTFNSTILSGHQTARPASRICNDFLLVHAIEAARELGILDRFAMQAEIELAEICGSTEHLVVGALLDVLSRAGVLSSDAVDGPYRRGPDFESIYQDRGYIYWITKACGKTLSRWAEFARPENGDKAADARATAPKPRDQAR